MKNFFWYLNEMTFYDNASYLLVPSGNESQSPNHVKG